GPAPASLQARLLDGPALRLERLDPDGAALQPREIAWKPSAVPPTTDDLQALRRAAEQRGDAAATHWEQERRARMEEAIDAAFRSGTAAANQIAELAFQLGERGPYRRAALGGWEELRHPAPTITRLYCARDAFERLYYEARVLEERLPSGQVEGIPGAFERAS